MGTGYPDFFGQSIFLKYGGARELEGSETVTLNDDTTILSLNGKGNIYHLEASAYGNITLVDDFFKIVIDGIETATVQPSDHLIKGKIRPVVGFWSLMCLNIETPRTAVMFSGIVTFDQSVSLVYTETGGNTPSVGANLRYSIVS